MAENNARLEYLYRSFINNTASPEEVAEFFRLIGTLDDAHPLRDMIFNEYHTNIPQPAGLDEERWSHSLNHILKSGSDGTVAPETPVVTVHRPRKVWTYAAAAAILIIFGVSLFYVISNNGTALPESGQSASIAPAPDLSPGKTGAVLTLSDGSVVNLDSAGAGLLALQGSARIINNNGVLNYQQQNGSKGEMVYNTIATPKGRQFSVMLADGSRVWLNAASSIRYPASFNGNDREVHISGEVYFEIAKQYRKDASGKNIRVPFIVRFTGTGGNNTELHVLGTHFNVNTYADNDKVKTTLLEGGIKLVVNNTNAITLQPGQQGNINSDGTIGLINNADIESVMAWKNGYFSFNNTDMVTLMNEIGRWYDVEIEYAGKIPDRKFGGEISRNSNASQVLKIMEESDVHFRIEGKKIVVLP